MIGLVPKLLVNLIESQTDERTVETVKKKAGVPIDRTYSINCFYSEDEWQRLFRSTCETLNVSQEDAEPIFAEFFYRDAIERWPRWFEMSPNSFEFLKRQPAIHNLLALSCPDRSISQSVNDKFEMKWESLSLQVKYHSPNLLCGLFKSMARKIAEHYGDRITIHENRCMKQGDDHCQIRVNWNLSVEKPS